MNYLESGTGRTVFLLHAFPLDHRMWDAQIECLTPHYRVIAPDLPGFGGSGPATEGWSLAGAAQEILKIADSLGADKFTIVGLSMGTYEAFEIYRSQPDRVARLVLANGRARADTAEERQARRELAQQIQSDGLVVLERRMFPRLLGRSPDSKTARQVREAIERAGSDAIVRALHALAERRDSTPLLDGMRCPVLVLGGNRDAITSPAECRGLAEAIPGAEYRELPDAGHLSNLDNPAAFNAAVTAFLDKVSSPDSR